jgi:hypothetical protein
MPIPQHICNTGLPEWAEQPDSSRSSSSQPGPPRLLLVDPCSGRMRAELQPPPGLTFRLASAADGQPAAMPLALRGSTLAVRAEAAGSVSDETQPEVRLSSPAAVEPSAAGAAAAAALPEMPGGPGVLLVFDLGSAGVVCHQEQQQQQSQNMTKATVPQLAGSKVAAGAPDQLSRASRALLQSTEDCRALSRAVELVGSGVTRQHRSGRVRNELQALQARLWVAESCGSSPPPLLGGMAAGNM